MMKRMTTLSNNQVSKKRRTMKIITSSNLKTNKSKTTSCLKVKKIKRSKLLKRMLSRSLLRTGPSQCSRGHVRLTDSV